MNILNSLGEIRRNNSAFKKWEDEQDSIDQKREELNKKNPTSQADLKKAKDLGKTIIDVVDIMDQHSEDVAENVETATAIPTGLFPFATLGLSGFLSYKKIIKPANKKMEEMRKEFSSKNEKRIMDLLQKINDENPGKHVYEHHLLNSASVERIKASPELKAEAKEISKEWIKLTKGVSRRFGIGILAPAIATIGAFFAGTIYATKLQVDGSKIARFQARKILEDPKYFVQYTPEQIEQAKKILANEKDKDKDAKTDKLKSGMFKSIRNLFKDRKAYKTWKASDKDETKKVNRPLSPEELIQAKKDQEVIQRVVRKVNNNAEIYSGNMEMASNVIIGGTPILGGLVGLAVSGILNMTNVVPKYIQKLVNQYGDDKAKAAYEALKSTPEKAPNRRKLAHDFRKAMFNADAGKNISPSKLENATRSLKKLMAVLLSTKGGKRKVFGVAGAIVTGLVGMVVSLKLQKASARAGRYVAKKDLERNPQNFIGYTDEELKSIPEPPKKAKPSKLKESIMFLPTVFKQYFEYQHYKKTELKQDKLLQDALTKLDVSESQLKDAKNLQRKIFNTFEKVDDKSQDYSESVEAAIEISQPFVFYGAIMLALSPIIVFGVKLAKGKINAKTITNKVVSLLNKSSNIMKKKFFKNYLKDVAAEIPIAVQKFDIQKPVFKKVLNGIDLSAMLNKRKNLKVGDICNDLMKGISNLNEEEFSRLKWKLRSLPIIKDDEAFKQVFNYNKEDAISILKQIRDNGGNVNISSLDGNLAKVLEADYNLENKIKEFSEKIKNMSDDEVKKMTQEWAKSFQNVSFIDNMDIGSIDKAYLEKIMPKLQTVAKNLPKEELENISNVLLDEFNKNPDEFIALVQSGKLTDVFMTKGLKRALKIAGLSYLALNVVVLYLIESWLANLQLKAGRLGVMKALDSLKDPGYYANAEETKTDSPAIKTDNANSLLSQNFKNPPVG